VGDHPVKVPAELIGEWLVNAKGLDFPNEWAIYVAAKAAQWAWDQREPELQERADQELEACIDVLGEQSAWDVLGECTGWKEFRDQSEEILRAARRPKPPTLAEQALEQYEGVEGILRHHGCVPAGCIRAALNRLAELEANQ